MNRTIRGMAGLLVALGASACANDYSLDFGGPPTMVQASPETMFITSGAAPKELLLRLVNERNQSVPAEWTITNVPAGLTVVKDEDYRPDWVNDNGELEPDALQVQHRYFVSADMPTGGMVTFTVTSQGISEQITVRVLPTDLGAALSSTAPAIGDEVTITAPANLSFTDASTVTIPGGGEAVIVSQSADAITFLPIPGSSGPATVTNVILDYAPTLAPRSLATSSSIDVAAVTSIPLAYSKTTLGATELVTVTATGFRFEEDVIFSYDGEEAFTQDVSADGTTATILAPTGLAGVTATVSNVHLSFLASVSLDDIPSNTAITTGSGPYPTIPGTGTAPANGGTPPLYMIPPPGTGMFIADMPLFTDTWWDGASHPSSWYQLQASGAGSRDFTVQWNNSADIDLFVVNNAISAYVCNSPSGANPEHCSGGMADGEMAWLVLELWSGAIPTEVLFTAR